MRKSLALLLCAKFLPACLFMTTPTSRGEVLWMVRKSFGKAAIRQFPRRKRERKSPPLNPLERNEQENIPSTALILQTPYTPTTTKRRATTETRKEKILFLETFTQGPPCFLHGISTKLPSVTSSKGRRNRSFCCNMLILQARTLDSSAFSLSIYHYLSIWTLTESYSREK